MKSFLQRHPFAAGWFWFVTFMILTALLQGCSALAAVVPVAYDCAKPAIVGEVGRLAPLVKTALDGDEIDWRLELGVLEANGATVLACTLAHIVQLSRSDAVTGRPFAAAPQSTESFRAATFMHEKRWSTNWGP